MKLKKKNSVVLEKKKKAQFRGKIYSVTFTFLAKFGKFTFLNLDFSSKKKILGQLGIFSANWERNLVPEIGPSSV